MSQLNVRLKPRKSSTSGEVPQPQDLEVAEIAINTADGRIFTKHTDNSIKEIINVSGAGLVRLEDDENPTLGGDLLDTKIERQTIFTIDSCNQPWKR